MADEPTPAPTGQPPTGQGTPAPANWQDIIANQAPKYGVPAHLALALAEKESNFNQDAIGGAKEVGLFQLKPDTSDYLGVKNPHDPMQNIDGGLRYLKEQLDRYNGFVEPAVAAYNAGPGNITMGQPYPNKAYVDDVMGRFHGRLAAETSGQPYAAPPHTPLLAQPPTLGSPTAPSRLVGPETWGERARRLGRTAGHDVQEALPGIGAAAGATAAAVSLSGPQAALGIPLMTYLGGYGGEAWRQAISAATAGPGTVPKTPAEQLHAMGSAGNEQVVFGAIGELLSPVTNALVHGIPLTPAQRAIKAVSDEFNLRLTPGEVSQNPLLRGVQKVGELGAGGQHIGERARVMGEKGSNEALTEILDAMGPGAEGGGTETGQAIQTGVRIGTQAAKTQAGKAMEAVEAQAGKVDMTGLQEEATRYVHDTLIPRLVQMGRMDPNELAGDLAGFSKTKQAQILARNPDLATSTGTMATPKEEALIALQAARRGIGTTKSATVDMLENIIKADPQVDFAVAKNLRSSWMKPGEDEIFREENRGLASHYTGQISDELEKAAPGWLEKSGGYKELMDMYRGAAFKGLLKSDPGRIVGTIPLKGGGYNRALALQKTLSPEDFDMFRRQWAQRNLTSTGAFVDADRQTMDALFGDAKGRVQSQRLEMLYKTMDQVMGKGAKHPYYRFMEGMDILRNVATGHVGGVALDLAAEEGIPAFFSWAMHSPAMTKTILDGLPVLRNLPEAQTKAMTPQLARLYGIWQQWQKDPNTPPESAPKSAAGGAGALGGPTSVGVPPPSKNRQAIGQPPPR